MKTLLLLRHAKSSWKDSDLDDHERPLTKRGKKDAARMGTLLRERDLVPDLIVSSSAKRCRQTVNHVIEQSGYRGETRITGAIYEADAAKLRQFVSGLDEHFHRVLVIGHNPGMEELVASIVGAATTLATAALAQVELPIEDWQLLDGEARGQLIAVCEPRELESQGG